MGHLRTYFASATLLATLVSSSALADPEIDELEALPANTLIQRVRSTGGFSQYSLGNGGCLNVTLLINVGRLKQQDPPAAPVNSKLIFVQYSSEDACTAGKITRSGGELRLLDANPEVPLTLDAMSTRRVTRTLTTRECVEIDHKFTCRAGAPIALDLTVQWVPTEEASRSSARSQTPNGDHYDITRYLNLNRPAVATLQGTLGARTLNEQDPTAYMTDVLNVVATAPR
ncbi:MAG: hypothetical protein ABW352_17915 [Polyangiales bacterium]